VKEIYMYVATFSNFIVLSSSTIAIQAMQQYFREDDGDLTNVDAWGRVFKLYNYP